MTFVVKGPPIGKINIGNILSKRKANKSVCEYVCRIAGPFDDWLWFCAIRAPEKGWSDLRVISEVKISKLRMLKGLDSVGTTSPPGSSLFWELQVLPMQPFFINSLIFLFSHSHSCCVSECWHLYMLLSKMKQSGMGPVFSESGKKPWNQIS